MRWPPCARCARKTDPVRFLSLFSGIEAASAAWAPLGWGYKAIGNSMAVPVMRWIGQRIDLAVLFQE